MFTIFKDLLEIFFYHVHELLTNSLSDSVPVVVTPAAISFVSQSLSSCYTSPPVVVSSPAIVQSSPVIVSSLLTFPHKSYVL